MTPNIRPQRLGAAVRLAAVTILVALISSIPGAVAEVRWRSGPRVAPAQPTPEALRGAIAALAERPDRKRVVAHFGGPVDHQARELLVGRMTGLMARGQARGEINADHTAEELARAFDSLAHGTIVNWLYDDPSKSLRGRMGRSVEILLGGIAIRSTKPSSNEPLPDLRDAANNL